jgi:hypothetical protein
MLYRNSELPMAADGTETALYIPITHITTKYTDNTRARPVRQFSDSFFVDAINQLTPFELAKRFTLTDVQGELPETLQLLQSSRFTAIKDSSTADSAVVAALVRAAAARYDADFVAIPYDCTVTNRVFQAKGWRGGKYESSAYEKPTDYVATTRFHMQVWSRDGRIAYERAGSISCKQPFLYTVLKREKQKGDIVSFAKRFYAPPLLRALYKAIKGSLQIVG